MKKIIMAVVLVALTLTLTVPAFAETAVKGTSVDFETYVVLDKNANVPNMTVTYTIKAGKAQSATGSTPAVKAGLTGAQLKADNGTKGTSTTVTFAPSDATVASGKNKKATHSVTVDLSGVTFKTPGIYRYEIAQTGGGDGVAADTTTTTRYLDVYVTTNGTALSVDSYVMHLDNTILSSGSYKTKQSGFGYSTKDLTISKTVSGNMGNRSEYFFITLKLGGAVKGTVYDVDVSKAPNELNAKKIYIGNDGTAEITFFVKDGESVTIRGLTADTMYEISEDNGDYIATYSLNEAEFVEGNAVPSTKIGQKNNTVVFNNDKNVNAPTGVKTNVIVYAVALGVVVLAGVAAVVVKKAKENEN